MPCRMAPAGHGYIYAYYTHSLMRLDLPFYAVYRAIFMLPDALFCAVHCSTIFRPHCSFCVVRRIIFVGQVPRFTCGAFAFSFCQPLKFILDFRLLHSSHCPHSPAFRPHFADDLPRRRDAGGGSQRPRFRRASGHRKPKGTVITTFSDSCRAALP